MASLPTTFDRIVACFFAYLVLLGVHAVITRLYLSPLAKVPGPKLAALSYLYEWYYDIVQQGRFPFKVRSLHEQYGMRITLSKEVPAEKKGPVVRINPHEVHISDPDYLEHIYAIRGRNDPTAAGGFQVKGSVGACVTFASHKVRRDALNPCFTKKYLVKLEPTLREKTTQLLHCFEKAVATDVPFNLSDAFFAYSNDFIKTFCFGTDDGLLMDIKSAGLARDNLAKLLRGIHWTKHFGTLLSLLSRWVPVLTPDHLLDLFRFKKDIRKEVQRVLDRKSQGNSVSFSAFDELRDSPVLPQHEKTLDRLSDEGTLMIMAGTESPAKSMGIAAYYLLANPHILARVRDELRQAPEDPTITQLTNLPYLGAVIAEAHRLSFGVVKRQSRTASHETLTYEQYTFPPGTWLSTLSYCTHTNENIFPEPWKFDPERWLGPEGAERKRYQQVFGKGHRKCVGMNVADAEIVLAIKTFVGFDMSLFETDESDIKFRHEYHISHPKPDSKGVRVMVKGKILTS